MGGPKVHYLIASVLLVILPPVIGTNLFEEDFIEAGKLSDAGSILPLEVILQRLRETNPGRILEVELEREKGSSVYKIELLDSVGQVWELSVDAVSGSVLQSKFED